MLSPKTEEIEGKEITFACEHFRTFPPLSAMLGVSPEELRDQGKLSTAGYQQAKVWERVCGLKEMEVLGKCAQCPHLRYLEVGKGGKVSSLVTLDGKKKTPIVDIPTIDASPRFRNPGAVSGRREGTAGTGSYAPWLKNLNKEEDPSDA